MTLLDVLLAAALPVIAWRVLVADRLSSSFVLFIAFGFLSALAWARLDAPDVALVEAAVGTGLTGALLMSSLRFVREPPPATLSRHVAIPLVAIGLASALGVVIASLSRGAEGLGPVVTAHLHESGATHPVTAVLVNFRGHDTHLEVVVLLTAAIAVRVVHRSAPVRDAAAPAAPLLGTLVDLLLPVLVLVATYLIWRGSSGPGGAFQAGAMLAGAAVLLMLAGRMRPLTIASPYVRGALLIGPLVFLALAAAPLIAGGELLEYPRGAAKTLILGLEVSLTVSIATVLALFFPAPPAPDPPDAEGGGPR